MRLSVRVFGALLALTALSAYFAAGLWASMCPLEMQMAGVEQVVTEHESHCPEGMNHHSVDPSESPESPGSDAPGCPLGPLGAGGSCVAVSLPAPVTLMAPSSPGGATLSLSPDTARDLLLVAASLRPPIA